jgi:hypothetical protein
MPALSLRENAVGANCEQTGMLAVWQLAIQQSRLPPLAKLACLNLSLYMDEAGAGEGCCQDMCRQMRDTGLPYRTLAEHLRIACESGFLICYRSTEPQAASAGAVYRPAFPGSLVTAAGMKPDEPPSPASVTCPRSLPLRPAVFH